MSHKSIFAIFISCLVAGCHMDAQSWMKEGIKGEGDVIKQEITLESLRGINLAFDGDVVLTPGSTQKIVLEGQQNILDNIKRDVKDGNWNIGYVKNVHDAKDVTVYIALPGIEQIRLTGSGSIHSTGKFTGLNKVDIEVSGSGDVTFQYDAQSTNMQLSGSGTIEAAGTSNSLMIAISGSGDVKAQDLIADDCTIHISGSGDASVQANRKLESSISGSGDVSYSGTASVTTKISGSGEVSKIR